MTRTLAERQAFAIARSREERRHRLAPLRVEVAEAIAAVGWRRARPVVAAVLAPVPVRGRHGAWWERVGVRSGRRILAELAALPRVPVQGRLALGMVKTEVWQAPQV